MLATDLERGCDDEELLSDRAPEYVCCPLFVSHCGVNVITFNFAQSIHPLEKRDLRPEIEVRPLIFIWKSFEKCSASVPPVGMPSPADTARMKCISLSYSSQSLPLVNTG